MTTSDDDTRTDLEALEHFRQLGGDPDATLRRLAADVPALLAQVNRLGQAEDEALSALAFATQEADVEIESLRARLVRAEQQRDEAIEQRDSVHVTLAELNKQAGLAISASSRAAYYDDKWNAAEVRAEAAEAALQMVRDIADEMQTYRDAGRSYGWVQKLRGAVGVAEETVETANPADSQDWKPRTYRLADKPDASLPLLGFDSGYAE